MKDFVGNLYNYNYCAQKVKNDQIDDDSDIEIILCRMRKYLLNIF